MIYLLLILILSACQVDNPVSKDYPCGTRAHQCPSQICCWNYEICTEHGCESNPDPDAFGSARLGSR